MVVPLTWLKKTAGCPPFVLGLILGLAISYGIRVLSSKSNRCQQSMIKGVSLNPNKNPHPDQIVNLDFHASILKDENKLFSASKPPNERSTSNSTQKCIGKEKCGTGKVERNGKQDLLFVGIMTANKYIATRAQAIWETWAQDVPGKVVFFTGGNSYVNEVKVGNRKSTVNETIPLVLLPGVDDSYPPQKKSFMMLK